jgi:hypothetical protein
VTAPVPPEQARDGLLYPLGRRCCEAPDVTACHQRDLCVMKGIHPASVALSPAREAAAVLSDRELSAALVLWYRLRDDDGTLVETVARAICPGIYCESHDECRDDAAAAIEAVRGEVR